MAGFVADEKLNICSSEPINQSLKELRERTQIQGVSLTTGKSVSVSLKMEAGA